jgi:hypothetical protein
MNNQKRFLDSLTASGYEQEAVVAQPADSIPIAPKIRMFDLRRDFKAIRSKVIMILLLVLMF